MSIHTETYKGYTINIEPDYDASNPLEDWDHYATLVSPFHDYLSWKSIKPLETAFELERGDVCTSMEDMIAFIKEHEGARVVLRVFKYEHGAVKFWAEGDTGPSCRFDTGQYGLVYDTPDALRKAWGDTVPTDEQIADGLRGIVASYSQYANGEAVGYSIEHDEDPGWVGDSCWGFYDDIDNVVKEAKEQIDWRIEHLASEDAKVARCMAL